MSGDELLKGALALIAIDLGQEHGANAIIGIMLAIRNRVKNGNWVPVLNDVFDSTVVPCDLIPDTRNPVVQQALQAADSVFDGSREDNLVHGATHWAHYGSMMYQHWERTASIGQLGFYKLVEA